ncbi:FkbM family methyltransferase [Halalkalicoccus sp. NIPERK01]|uniref:FkbM family methyltransferase n=1 Tax=Halalkalicoccus sp. NIPERK01 TaxID=3053469 RepID=UPI00256F645C|nr:FkbM family methyltransferase [Halalkalicoccus sp. NIPERK01]MDL5362850.1 FkbM family methyltransferase [Halalkalicoccus sp. NIPERK01]
MAIHDRVAGIQWEGDVFELVRKAGRSARRRASDRYWAARGRRPVTVGGVSVLFRLDDREDARFLRRFLDIEGRMLADLLAELRSDDVFWDVGAAGGFYTCFASAVLDDGRVIAFEPNPDVREILHRRLDSLGTAPRVFECALSDSTGTAALDNPARERDSWQGTPSLTTDPGAAAVSIETRAGDELVAAGEVPRPTVVKIDVEGAEPLVVEGLSESLAHEDCRLVYCEVHRESDQRRSPADYGSSPAAVEASLADLGFEIEHIEDRRAEYLIKAKKRPSGEV